jgi:hypothetical protein
MKMKVMQLFIEKIISFSYFVLKDKMSASSSSSSSSSPIFGKKKVVSCIESKELPVSSSQVGWAVEGLEDDCSVCVNELLLQDTIDPLFLLLQSFSIGEPVLTKTFNILSSEGVTVDLLKKGVLTESHWKEMGVPLVARVALTHAFHPNGDRHEVSCLTLTPLA